MFKHRSVFQEGLSPFQESHRLRFLIHIEIDQSLLLVILMRKVHGFPVPFAQVMPLGFIGVPNENSGESLHSFSVRCHII